MTIDMTVGVPIHGYADSLPDAKVKLRAAFDVWLAWAKAVPPEDPKYRWIAAEPVRIGVG